MLAFSIRSKIRKDFFNAELMDNLDFNVDKIADLSNFVQLVFKQVRQGKH